MKSNHGRIFGVYVPNKIKKAHELTTQEIKKHLMIFYYEKNEVTLFFQLLDEPIGIWSNHIDFFAVDDAFSIKVNRL